MKRDRAPELLSPGGSYEKIRIAYLYGADAVYCGGSLCNLRSHARNLGTEEIAAAIFLSRAMGKKLYVTVNAYARSADLGALPPFFEYLRDLRVDGIIVADPGVIRLARRYADGIPLHLSTQANTTNVESLRFWRDQGVHRVNLARELAWDEILELCGFPDMELEVFVHGAMCMAYSGRCLLSSFLTGRSANQGLCTQPCRWKYHLVEEKRPGEYFPLEEDAEGSYILNSKDLCLIENLAPLVGAGVDSLKIEGRMKAPLYVATVTRAYRQALDLAVSHPIPTPLPKTLRGELDRVSHRPYTAGHLFQPAPDDAHMSPHEALSQPEFTLAGLVRRGPVADFGEPDCSEASEAGWIWLEVRSRITRGMSLEFLVPDGSSQSMVLTAMEDTRGAGVKSANPNSLVRVPVTFATFPSQVVRTRVR